MAKIVAVREQPAEPAPHHRDRPDGDVAERDRARRRCASAAAARDAAELQARSDAVAPEDPFTFIYTSGTTGPPKGCVLTHGNYRSMLDMCDGARRAPAATSDVIYLFLPLAHAFALLIQLLVVRPRRARSPTSAATPADRPRARARSSRPTCRRCRASSRRSTRSRTTPAAAPEADRPEPSRSASRSATSRSRGEEVPEELRDAVRAGRRAKCSRTSRDLFGGSLRQAVSGAAPIAHEILEFFCAAGVPVLEGYGMTETATAATYSTIEDHRFGTVGRALPGVEIKIADDGEILVKGPNIFGGYYKSDDASFGAVDRGLAAHRRPRLDRRGRLPVDHRPQEGHHHHRRRQEPHAGQHRERPQAEPLDLPGGHARRPPAVPGRARSRSTRRRSSRGRRSTACRGHLAARSRSTRRCSELIQAELDRANAHYAQVEQVKKFVDPRPRPLAGDRRADADAEGQAQRRQREVRGPLRRAVRRARRGVAPSRR